MKSYICTSILLVSLFSANAQEKKRDTLAATEVVNVITKYNPQIADVKKIEKNPTNTLLEKSNKKKLKYLIYSAPVASTFIPKTGVVKGIDVGVKERVYRHYLATGFGNYKSPYTELFISKSKRFTNAFGLHATYNASAENIDTAKLNSTFSNFSASTFYTQEERYFNWKIHSDVQRNSYNWFGLPQDRTFSETVLNTIDAAQNYNYIALAGDFNFYDSYLKTANVSVGYLIDRFKSSEIVVDFNTDVSFPIPFFKNTSNEIAITAGLEFLKGSFKNNYQNTNAIHYQQNTLKIIPQYNMDYRGLSLKASLRTFVALDTENKSTNFFAFPEIQLQTAIYKQYIHGTIGFTGNLHTNTYQQFTAENPFVSPTLFITQTAETSNLYIALNGSISRVVSYNLKVSVKKEEDKPLFLRNMSKSDTVENPFNDTTLKGYEYGNSFTVYYDDVQTSSIFAEVDYHYNEKLRLSAEIKYNHYTNTNASENWNLPSMQSTLLANYKAQKWYATVSTFYISERLDVLYNSTTASASFAVARLNSFIDLNANGGYHFNDQFSAFLRLNNILNTEYQRFANFDTQGFQVLGGITYKFDF